MGPKGIFLTCLLICKICTTFPIASPEWKDLELHGAQNSKKIIRKSTASPAVNFKVDTLDCLNWQFYLSDPANVSRRKILGNFTRLEFHENSLKTRRNQRKSGDPGRHGRKRKQSLRNPRRFSTPVKAEHKRIKIKTENAFPSSEKNLQRVLNELKLIKGRIDETTKVSTLLDDFSGENANRFNDELLVFPEKNSIVHLSGESDEGKLNTNRKNHSPNLSVPVENEFKSVNILTHGNQYQIGNIFIFNQLPDKTISDFKGSRSGASSFQKFTSAESSEENFDNDDDDEEEETKWGDEFSKIFFSNNPVTPEHISQMSKVIDFVERYHGVMSDLNTGTEDLSFHATGYDSEEKTLREDRNSHVSVHETPTKTFDNLETVRKSGGNKKRGTWERVNGVVKLLRKLKPGPCSREAKWCPQKEKIKPKK